MIGFRFITSLALCLAAPWYARADLGAEVKIPLGLQPVPWPDDNPYTAAKAELGRMLFFDPRLSADFTLSCASCHSPRSGFSDANPVSTGVKGQKGTRHAPTIINSGYMLAQFRDGRAPTLESSPSLRRWPREPGGTASSWKTMSSTTHPMA